MELIIGKSKWEMWDDPLDSFVFRAKKDGFRAVEIYLKSLKESIQQIQDLIARNDMLLVGQILTEGKTYQEHIDSLKSQFDLAYKLTPLIINAHAGRDIFAFEENIAIYKTLISLSNNSGIPIYVETHRGRPTYSVIETIKYLNELPELQITADFSHWTVVHESDLSDQGDALNLAIERSRYIHARLGFQESPQINDPRAPEWGGILELFFGWWERIIKKNISKGTNILIMTPEFGPPGYMPTLPYTNLPIADPWEVNVYMKNLISQRIMDGKNIAKYF